MDSLNGGALSNYSLIYTDARNVKGLRDRPREEKEKEDDYEREEKARRGESTVSPSFFSQMPNSFLLGYSFSLFSRLVFSFSLVQFFCLFFSRTEGRSDSRKRDDTNRSTQMRSGEREKRSKDYLYRKKKRRCTEMRYEERDFTSLPTTKEHNSFFLLLLLSLSCLALLLRRERLLLALCGCRLLHLLLRSRSTRDGNLKGTQRNTQVSLLILPPYLSMSSQYRYACLLRLSPFVPSCLRPAVVSPQASAQSPPAAHRASSPGSDLRSLQQAEGRSD